MVVGFVNSGLMNLKQAINVIMGANVGTTVTAWLLSLSGIESDNLFVQLFKPTSFTPILALIGIIFYMFCSSSKKKDTGTILLGFAVLMFGMDTMSAAVSGLSEVESFRNMFVAFENPLFGVLAGTLLTAIIQSSSGFGRNTPGFGCNRSGIIRSGDTNHNGTEYRNLHNGYTLIGGNQ